MRFAFYTLNMVLLTPTKNKSQLATTLRGIKCVNGKGLTVSQKKPITPHFLLAFKSHLNLDNSLHATFWAVCLVTFFGLLRKASLQCKGFTQFNLFKHYAGETYSSLLTRPASSIDGQRPFNLVSAF